MRKTPPQMWMPALLGLLLCLLLPVTAFAAEELPDSDEFVQSGIDLDTDYMTDKQELCMTGDTEMGKEVERQRNLKIDLLDMQEAKISFQDLFLISKLIASEAGSSWLPLEWKMAVGEVLLNRVVSPEFPNTIEACVYAPGQYFNVTTGAFQRLLPDRDSVIAATRLLYGERVLCDSSVVFQSNFRQGEVFLVLHDDYLGDTYLCKSAYPELYTQSLYPFDGRKE